MIPRLDRYILREMVPPYCLAMAVIIIFISMNLLALLAEYMINRDVSWTDLLRILFYRMPELVVVGLPIAVLFGVFLTLGRLVHDRELIALQSSGISLRRAIVPVVAFGLIISAFTFLLNEQVTPWSMQQYWNLLGRLASRGALPQIQDNTIFKDASGRFFYVKRYYRQTERMEDVLVYDPNGQTYLPELGGPFPQMISAKEAQWDGVNWTLRQGIAHVFDAEGALSYQARFETLTIKVGDAIENFFVQQRQPREMNLGELAKQIETFQKAGQPVSNLVVEYHYKLVLPLSALVYALLTAPLSLSFGLRGRAMGTVVGLLLAFLFQGALYTVIVLSRRELLPPDWGPWLPNIVFGLAGVVLIFNVDRLSRLELGRWFARAAVLLLIALPGVHAGAQETSQLPLEVEAQALEISDDGQSFLAQGDVRARYGEQTIDAQELRLEQLDAQHWRLEASGEVSLSDPSFRVQAKSVEALLERSGAPLAPREITLFEFTVNTQGELGQLQFQAQVGTLRFARQLEEVRLEGQVAVQAQEFQLTAQALTFQRAQQGGWRLRAQGDVELAGLAQKAGGDSLELELQIAGDTTRVQAMQLENFSGEGTFKNALGQEHPIRYQGQRAQFLFEGEQLKQLTLDQARFTTCACEDAVEKSSYSLGGKQVILWSDEWVLGREITLKTYGIPVFWLPLFFAPLKDIERNDLLPRLGTDAQRGWFAQWRLPVFVDGANRGALLVDYYNRYRETGLGLDWNYTLPVQTQSGRLQLYHLVGSNEVLDWSWSHQWPISELAQLQWSLTRRDVQPATAAPSHWSYALQLAGQRAGWGWQLAGAREEISQEDEAQPSGEKPKYQVLERLPELSVSHRAQLPQIPLLYGATASWGRFREQRGQSEPFLERDRLDAGANVSLTPLEIQSASLRVAAAAGARYSLYGADQQRSSGQFQADVQWAPFEAISASVSYVYQAVQGQSPFAFDALSVADRLSAQLRFSLLEVQCALSGAYAFNDRRFEPITLEFNTSISQYSLNAVVRSRPNALSVDAVQLQGSWSPAWGQVSASGGYLVSAGRFSDLIVKGSVGQVRLGARVDLNTLRLLRSNAEFAVSWEPWSLDFRGEYDWRQGRFSALQVGLVHHFCHDCWQAGVYLSGQRIWLQVQINAFPGAGVQYSPTDGALSFN